MYPVPFVGPLGTYLYTVGINCSINSTYRVLYIMDDSAPKYRGTVGYGRYAAVQSNAAYFDLMGLFSTF